MMAEESRGTVARLPKSSRLSAAFDIEHTRHMRCCKTAGSFMDKADNDRVHELCSLIALEPDQQKVLKLVDELNRILSAKEGQPHSQPGNPKSD